MREIGSDSSGALPENRNPSPMVPTQASIVDRRRRTGFDVFARDRFWCGDLWMKTSQSASQSMNGMRRGSRRVPSLPTNLSSNSRSSWIGALRCAALCCFIVVSFIKTGGLRAEPALEPLWQETNNNNHCMQPSGTGNGWVRERGDVLSIWIWHYEGELRTWEIADQVVNWHRMSFGNRAKFMRFFMMTFLQCFLKQAFLYFACSVFHEQQKTSSSYSSLQLTSCDHQKFLKSMALISLISRRFTI